jgi:hypothetical protein
MNTFCHPSRPEARPPRCRNGNLRMLLPLLKEEGRAGQSESPCPEGTGASGSQPILISVQRPINCHELHH